MRLRQFVFAAVLGTATLAALATSDTLHGDRAALAQAVTPAPVQD